MQNGSQMAPWRALGGLWGRIGWEGGSWDAPGTLLGPSWVAPGSLPAVPGQPLGSPGRPQEDPGGVMGGHFGSVVVARPGGTEKVRTL